MCQGCAHRGWGNGQGLDPLNLVSELRRLDLFLEPQKALEGLKYTGAGFALGKILWTLSRSLSKGTNVLRAPMRYQEQGFQVHE